MKKTLVLFFLLYVFISATYCESVTVGADLASLQDLIPSWSDRTGQVMLDTRADLSDTFELRIPLSVTLNERAVMLETGLFLVYYPWNKGPFMGLSLAQMGYVAGDAWLEKTVYPLNEALVGWNFRITKHFSLEASVSVRDPSGIYKDEYLAIKGEFPCYKSFRGHLMVCWQVWSNNE